MLLLRGVGWLMRMRVTVDVIDRADRLLLGALRPIYLQLGRGDEMPEIIAAKVHLPQLI